ncbi:MAG: class I SAM-dependent methyltransferase [Xenococcaceae cyanobacterium MO_167.B27]|nr:class I SAM-dependent methyltransferase [Xenococcaceae cyanobacterium MO_167.B27]
MYIRSPLTETNNISLIKTIRVDELIQKWKNNFQIDITQELKNYQEIKLYQCNQTRLKFFFPCDIDGSETLYKQLQKFDWFYLPDKWEYNVALNHLKLLNCNSILEVGCGVGFFVKACIDSGFVINGIELNKLAVNLAQENKLPVNHITLQEFAQFHPQSMDAICSFQVLEHISDPKSFINNCLKILKSGGRLIVSVPNAESFLKYQYNLLDMPPHHMTQWSEFSFRSLEKIFPVKTEKIIKEPLASYHISGYVDSYKNYLTSSFYPMNLLFNRFSIYFYKKILKAGLRKFLTGQSLYVQFCKII